MYIVLWDYTELDFISNQLFRAPMNILPFPSVQWPTLTMTKSLQVNFPEIFAAFPAPYPRIPDPNFSPIQSYIESSVGLVAISNVVAPATVTPTAIPVYLISPRINFNISDCAKTAVEE